MMQLFRYLGSIGMPIGLFGVVTGLFIVQQTEQVLVVQFGEHKRTIKEPGLYWMMPFIQTLIKYEKRVLNCDISEIELTLGDQKRIVITVFARYFIENPELFYKTVQSESRAQQRLEVIINGDLRNILGKCSLQDLLSEKRLQIESTLNQQLRESARSMGMDMMEVRIKGIFLPEKNKKTVFERMKSERLREAQEWRGKASKISSEIKSEADVTAARVLAEAERDSQIIIGEAGARALELVKDVYKQDRDFGKLYLFYNSYEKSLPGAEIVLEPTHNYLELMNFHK
jgi:modulator of FtsH protease HflC